MKTFVFAVLAHLCCSAVIAQTTCTLTGPDGYSGPVTPALVATCGNSTTPPPPPPAAQCDVSQSSSPIGGKTLHRQCNGGTISISTVPGAMTQGGVGFVCGVSRSAANGVYPNTAGGVCGVRVGTTYYINLADVDAAGNNLCFNGRPNTCASSTVSYTIYAGTSQ